MKVEYFCEVCVSVLQMLILPAMLCFLIPCGSVFLTAMYEHEQHERNSHVVCSCEDRGATEQNFVSETSIIKKVIE